MNLGANSARLHGIAALTAASLRPSGQQGQLGFRQVAPTFSITCVKANGYRRAWRASLSGLQGSMRTQGASSPKRVLLNTLRDRFVALVVCGYLANV